MNSSTLPYNLFTVQSGSMEPVIHTGSVVVTKAEPVYKIGDIITYRMQPMSDDTATHRIIGIDSKPSGFILKTKGDANNVMDGNAVLAEQVIGKVHASIPYIGYPIMYLRTGTGFTLLIIVPIILFVFREVVTLHREIGIIMKKKHE